MATDNFAAPPDVHDSTTTLEAAGSPPVAIPAAPQSISAADAAAIELPSSPPATNETSQPAMSAVHDEPTPSLPERPGPLPRESSLPTARSVPNVDPDQTTEIPEIASLKAMFPDFDVAVLQSVLESCGGNQDRAIDMLLGMSDPDYVSQQPPAPVQTDLDEEFARQLMLEDQQQQERQQSGGRGQPGYVPRARGQQWQQQQQQQQPVASPAGQRDGLADLQEQVAKFADTGKKTFSSLLTKAKAKLQEFDQQRTGQSSAQAGTQPSWGAQQYEAPSQSYGQPPGQAQPSYGQPPPQAQPSYYDPNPQPTRQDSFASTQGYDTTPLPSSQTPYSAAPPVGSAAPSVAALSSTAVAGSAPTTPAVTTPRPPATSSGAPPIDPSKLGMLPKRPVSLLRDPSQPPARHDDDDDDELEYAENPFEEHR
ncbi:hypothetical protein HWV62_8963 [Athelia sp. TMB]|nr:hypothetical protein HWV62_8963 [Athelia sp. TMB]